MESANRRSVPRVRGRQGDYASFPGGVAPIRDLSLGGVMLADREPLPLGSPVRMDLHLGVEVVSCAGVVIRSEADRGMAVEFLELSSVARNRLGAHLLQADVAEGRYRLTRKVRVAAHEVPSPPVPPIQRVPPSLPATPCRLNELLLRCGRITRYQLDAVAAQPRFEGETLVQVLVRLGVISEQDLVSLFHDAYCLPVIDLRTIAPTANALRLVSPELARRHEILPVGVAGSTLTVATSDPSNVDGLNAVKFRSGYDLKITIAQASALHAAIDWFYAHTRDAR